VIAWLVLLQASLAIAVPGPAGHPEYLPLRVAEAEGYFAQEKLSVSLHGARSEAAAAQALGRGQVALAATSVDAAMRVGHAGGEPPRLVFGLTAAPPVAVLVPAARKAEIRGLADLAGRTVGIPSPGTPAELALVWLLARAHVRVNQVTITSHGERALPGALDSGALDAAVIADPWATRLIEAGRAVALADLRDRGEAASRLGGPTVSAALFARADTTLGPAELVPLLRALLHAVERIRTATPAELQARLPASAAGDPDDFDVVVRGIRKSFLPDGRVSRDAIEAAVALVQARTPVPAKVNLPRRLDRLLLMEPLEQALRQP
jgi:ABC-type nitrate/sulfonate/bicarbonate transport system substrate-binding protein